MTGLPRAMPSRLAVLAERTSRTATRHGSEQLTLNRSPRASTVRSRLPLEGKILTVGGVVSGGGGAAARAGSGAGLGPESANANRCKRLL